MPREVSVALHDIEPGTFEHCALIREWLADLGVQRVTLCVAEPGRALGEWLRERGAAGDAISPDPGTPGRRLERRPGELRVHVHPRDFAHPWRAAALERLLRHMARRRRLRSDMAGVLSPR